MQNIETPEGMVVSFLEKLLDLEERRMTFHRGGIYLADKQRAMEDASAALCALVREALDLLKQEVPDAAGKA